MGVKTRWRATGLALVTLLAGCGGVRVVDVHDARLPLDARRWVGGAEDAVTIARAAVQDANLERAELERWKETLPRSGEVDGGAGGLVKPLRAMADAQIALAERRVDLAEAKLTRARASLELVYAETDMRYDLGVYDLAALRAVRDDAHAEVELRAAEVDEALAALDRDSGTFWTAYRRQAKGGADDTLMWLPVHHETGLLAH